MSTRSFENLDFSILIEVDKNVAFLQQWNDGAWSEPHCFTLPLSREEMQRIPVLSQAVKSFRRDPRVNELRDALTDGAWRFATEENSGVFTRFRAAVQASCRLFATARVKELG